MNNKTLKELNNDLIKKHLEDNEDQECYGLVEDLYNSYYILYDGSFLGCYFDSGIRADDHNLIFTSVIEEIEEYNFEALHNTYKLLRFMPEANCVYVDKNQQITPEQQNIINEYDLEIIRY